MKAVLAKTTVIECESCGQYFHPDILHRVIFNIKSDILYKICYKVWRFIRLKIFRNKDAWYFDCPSDTDFTKISSCRLCSPDIKDLEISEQPSRRRIYTFFNEDGKIIIEQ